VVEGVVVAEPVSVSVLVEEVVAVAAVRLALLGAGPRGRAAAESHRPRRTYRPPGARASDGRAASSVSVASLAWEGC